MKVILFVLALVALTLSFRDNTCPESKQIVCIDDIRAGYPACQKAIDAGGSDMIADLTCLKYFNSMKADCWPCICMVAKLDNIKVKGC